MMTVNPVDYATHNGKPKHAPLAFRDRVRNGFTRAHLARHFCHKGAQIGVEVGVADGRNALTLCQSIPNVRLICVDPWAPYQGNTRGGPREQHECNWKLAQARLAGFNVDFRRKQSMDAVREIAPNVLDFCYLDGNHAFDWIMADLIEWSKRVKPGGFIAGHDFYYFDRAGVVEAVDAYTQAHGITDWSLTDEREPSFWWVKRA